MHSLWDILPRDIQKYIIGWAIELVQKDRMKETMAQLFSCTIGIRDDIILNYQSGGLLNSCRPDFPKRVRWEENPCGTTTVCCGYAWYCNNHRGFSFPRITTKQKILGDASKKKSVVIGPDIDLSRQDWVIFWDGSRYFPVNSVFNINQE